LSLSIALSIGPRLWGQEAARETPEESRPTSPATVPADGDSARREARRSPEGAAFPLALGTLPGGKSLTIVFRTTIADPFTGDEPQVSNQGTVTGSNFGPVVTDDPDTATPADPTVTPVDLQPDLSVAKSDGGATVSPGGTVSYTLAYTNHSSFGAPGVVLTDTVPAHTTFNAGASSAGWACVPDNNPGSVCTLTVGLVGGSTGGSRFFAVTVADPAPAGVVQVSNTASVASGLPDPVPGNNSSTDTTPVDAAPDLTIAKSDGGASTTPGGTIPYTLSYANAGNQGASGVTLTDVVPANATFNPGGSTAGWVCAPDNNPGSVCTLAVGELAGGGAGGSAIYAVTVADPVPAGVAQISNTGTIADDGANGADPNPGDNSSTDTTPVDAAPDLNVAKSDGGASVTPGGTVAYALSYANAGNQGATGVTLADTVPAHTTFDAGSSTAGWVCVPDPNAGSACTLAVGALAAGGSGSATFAVIVDSPVPAGVAEISNTGTVADDGTNGADPTPGDNASTDTTPVTAAPDLAIVKDDLGASVTPGGTVTYTLSYSNVGDQGATGVTLTDTVPANATFNPGASTAGWACVPDNNAGSACTLAVGALAAGGSGSAAYAVTVADPIPAGVTEVSNTATVADDGANGADPNGANNTDSETTPIVAAPDMAVVKSDGGATTVPGGTVPYDLSYSNTGNRGATGVVLTDVVPASTTFDPGASTAGWSCVPDNNPGSTCTLAVGAVPAGASGAATFAVDVVTPAPAGLDQVANTASVADDGTNGADPNTANNTSTETTPVTAAPDLEIAKGDGGATVAPGGTIPYALTYANTGNQGASGVALGEVVPTHAAFNPAASTAGWACVPDNSAGSTCTLPIGALGAGAVGAATFAVTVLDPVPSGAAQVSNTATVADDGANGPDPTPANNSASDTTPIDAAPDLALTKSDGGAGALLGGPVAYTLGYSNIGSQGATGVVLTDVVPAHTTFDAAGSTAGWSCVPDNNAGSTCTLTVAGSVAGGGGSGSAVFAVTVAASVPAGVTEIANQASVADDGTNGPDPNPADNTASDVTPLVLVADVTVAELVHGSVATESLAAQPGPQPDADLFRVMQEPYSSYEVVVDATAGGVNTLVLERLDASGTTVLQTAQVVGTGPARSLRFANETGAAVASQLVRIRSGSCTTTCPAEAQYRLRAYETTYALERFNNVSPQVTVLVLQNRGVDTVAGTVWFWDETGSLVGSQVFSVAARAVLVLNTSTITPGASGSMTVTSDAPYGMLAGKAAQLDPVAGPAYDVMMKARVR
jgi:uncharacterized repeat protein (TIGR01451 family)